MVSWLRLDFRVLKGRFNHAKLRYNNCLLLCIAKICPEHGLRLVFLIESQLVGGLGPLLVALQPIMVDDALVA